MYSSVRMWRIVGIHVLFPTPCWMREPRSLTKTVLERPWGLCWDMDTTWKLLTRTMVQYQPIASFTDLSFLRIFPYFVQYVWQKWPLCYTKVQNVIRYSAFHPLSYPAAQSDLSNMSAERFRIFRAEKTYCVNAGKWYFELEVRWEMIWWFCCEIYQQLHRYIYHNDCL